MRYLWYPILVLNAIAILFLFLSVLSPKVSPEKIVVLAYLGLGFPIILTVNVCFLIFWTIFLRWRYALVSFCSLLLCISPILTYYPLKRKTAEVPKDCIKVLSYNVRAFNWHREKECSQNKTIQFIRDSEADIVCLQEFTSITNKKHHSLKEIRKVLSNYPYYSVTNLRPEMKNYIYGLACFSKYPILSTTEIPIETSDNGSVMYKIKVNGKTISVINNHLESNRLTTADKKLYRDFFKETNTTIDDVAQNLRNKLGTAFKKRAPQAEVINQWVKKQKTDGIIVCGDFNDTPMSYTYRTIKENLIDSYAETGWGPGITYHENHFWFRIDFIMHSPNIKSYNTTVGTVKYSDHYPIWSYLQLN